MSAEFDPQSRELDEELIEEVQRTLLIGEQSEVLQLSNEESSLLRLNVFAHQADFAEHIRRGYQALKEELSAE
jgi:hypothetical protein